MKELVPPSTESAPGEHQTRGLMGRQRPGTSAEECELFPVRGGEPLKSLKLQCDFYKMF